MFKKIIILAIILSTLLFNLKTAVAQTMSNTNYILQMGNLNSAAGKPTGSGYALNITVGQTAPGLYSGANYKVRAGFQYINSIIPFQFTLSSILVDFGTLTPTNPITRTSIISINDGSAGGYTVKVFENHQLLVPGPGVIIPNTTCDNGLCTSTTPDTWTSSLTYGFGYRCDQVDATNYCSSDFSSANNYKQFADQSQNQILQTVMSGQTGRNQRGQVTYKVNISPTQVAGFYSNVITYIATPTY